LTQEGGGKILSQPLLVELCRRMSEEPGSQFMRIKMLGEASLFTAGILGPHLNRSLVGIKYHTGLGELAYKFLFLNVDRDNKLSLVYREFSRDLSPFVEVLNEISVENIFETRLKDIIRVYERYVATGSKKDRLWLAEHGVVLLDGPDQKKFIV